MVLLTRRTEMPRKSYKPEEIVAKLRQVDVLISQGQGVAEAIRSIGVSEVTYYRWRQEFGGLKSDQIKRLKDLETETSMFEACCRSPSAVPVRRSASIAQRSARSRGAVRMKSG